MADGKLTYELVVDTSSGKASLKGFEQDAKKIGENTGDGLTKGLSKGLGPLGAIAGAAGVALAGAFAGGKILSAAIDAQDSVNKLSNSLTLIGENSTKTREGLLAFADSVQATTRFSDDAVISALALSQALGSSAAESQKVVSAATNLSTALGTDLESTVRQLSVTLGGTLPGSLAKVFPELKALTDEQLRAGAAVDILSNKFDGLAQKDANTLSGSLDKLTNSFDGFLEAIGGIVTESPALTASINAIASGFTFLASKISETFNPNETQKVKALDESIASLNARIQAAEPGGLFNRYSPAAIDFSNLNTLKKQLADLEAQRTSLLNVQKQEDAAVAKNQANVQTQLTNTELLAQSLTKLGFSQDEVAKATTNLQNVFFQSDEQFLTTLTSLQGLGLAGEELKRVLSDETLLQGAVASTQQISTSFTGMADAIQFSASRIKVTNAQIASSFVNGLAGGVGQAFGKVGAALANGDNIFKAFGDSLLGTFGGIIGDIGQGFILQGIAQSIAVPGSGAGLIAAGAAMKIFSGFLGAKSGGGANPSAAGGVGGQGQPLGQPIQTESRPVVDQAARTAIQVNIQGDVLDSDASGTRIVSLINDAFDKQGTVVSRNARFA